MFFTSVERVYLEQKREVVGGQSKVSADFSHTTTQEQQNMVAAPKAQALHLSAMTLNGSAGGEAF
jgi:hypothetical protein